MNSKKILVILIVTGLILIALGLYLWVISSLFGMVLWILGLIYAYYGKRKQENRDIRLLSGQEKIASFQKCMHA